MISVEIDNQNSQFIEALLKAREAFNRNVTKSVKFRIQQLKQLQRCLDENYDEFCNVLKADLSKSRFEAAITEIEFVKNDIDYQIKHIHEYMKPKYVKKGLANLFDDCYIKYEPYGVVLIFSAWNYPVQVLLGPLVGAIVAGNCALLKPSEVASNTEKLFSKLLTQYLDRDCYHVITGGPEEATRLLNERFDLIFFTGSSSIGKSVYKSASKFLTPVVLELGGKSPVYLDDSLSNSQLEVAIKRILWGKFVNSGQTCIAPDYVLCSKEIQDKIINIASKIIKEFYDVNPKKSNSYGRIINDKNFDRLSNILSSTNGKVVIGGEMDKETRYISPTIVSDVPSSDSLMKDEIFGPILPINKVDSVDEAVEFIKRGEKPLTLYLFTNKKKVVEKFSNETSSGSFCVNDVFLQMTVDNLPFGGVGNSGTGKYHGYHSFETFSHAKSVFAKDFNPIIEYLSSPRYPPYSEANLARMKLLTKKSFLDDINYGKIFQVTSVFLLGVATTVAVLFLK